MVQLLFPLAASLARSAMAMDMAGRGNSNCAMLEREYRGKWGNLALYAPELVSIDLVLAEALVTAVSQQPEEPS